MGKSSAPELIGSEKLNVKYHYYYMIFNIMTEASECIRVGDRGNLLAYQGALDTFYDTLLGSINEDQLKLGDEIKEIRKKLKESVKEAYLSNSAAIRLRYFLYLKEYQHYLLRNIRNTGLVQAKLMDLISGTGELDGEMPNIEEFLEPVEEPKEDLRGKRLNREEIKQLAAHKSKSPKLFSIGDDGELDDFEE